MQKIIEWHKKYNCAALIVMVILVNQGLIDLGITNRKMPAKGFAYQSLLVQLAMDKDSELATELKKYVCMDSL